MSLKDRLIKRSQNISPIVVDGVKYPIESTITINFYTTINGKRKKMAAEYTPYLAYDLHKLHCLDIEKELEPIIRWELEAEIGKLVQG